MLRTKHNIRLPDADLSGANLSDADQSRANLSMAILNVANLRWVDLKRVILSDATTMPNGKKWKWIDN